PVPEMSIRSPRALVLVATVAALTGVAPLVLAPEPAATSQTGPGVQLLDDARRAAQEQDFSGVLEVTWSDASGDHTSDVFVRSANGVLALGDRPRVIVEGARRFVQGPNGWLAVWSRETQPDVPPASAKWELSVHEGPTVAGRPTREVDATDRHGDKVRERLYLDQSTSLLLRREQLDTRGRTVRAVRFPTLRRAPHRRRSRRPPVPHAGRRRHRVAVGRRRLHDRVRRSRRPDRPRPGRLRPVALAQRPRPRHQLRLRPLLLVTAPAGAPDWCA